MVQLEQALEQIRNVEISPETESVPLTEALHRVLANDVFSDTNMPPFNKSAVDGYACKENDLKLALEVIEVIPAGKFPERKVGSGQCAKIMTGGVVPEGADTVIMIEHTKETENGKIQFIKETSKSNICYTGEDVKTGDKILKKGTLLKPQHLAILASTGCWEPSVYVLPSVGVITTGDELVEPWEKPPVSKIRNSNGYQLIGQLQSMHITAKYYGIVKDSNKDIENTISTALMENSLLLITGGVSMGDFDLVPGILNRLGLKVNFDKVAIQPGKPLAMATGNGKFCFALSGNPVSSFFQFEILVKPFLYKIMGGNFTPPVYSNVLSKTKTRKKTERQLFFPVKLSEDGLVEAIEFHGSAHITSLAYADGIVSFPIGTSELIEKSIVHVRPI